MILFSPPTHKPKPDVFRRSCWERSTCISFTNLLRILEGEVFEKTSGREDFLDSNKSSEHAEILVKAKSEDQIHIEQLEIWGRVGVADAEREKPQRLSVSITLWPFQRVDDLRDNVANTVDYSAVREEAKMFVQNRQDRLIETLADAIAMLLLKKFPIHKVRIELRKFVLPDAVYASVIVTRAAAIK